MSVWTTACQLLARYLTSEKRLDHLTEGLPGQLAGTDHHRAAHLVYGVVRHRSLLNAALSAHLRTPPRPLLQAALMTGAFELLEHPENAAVIVHHAVEQTRSLTSAREAGLVNAVLRRVAQELPDFLAVEPTDAGGLALRYSHPEWLVQRWLTRLGYESTHALLQWNQQPAEVFARIIGTNAGSWPASFRPSRWPKYFRLEHAVWSEVEARLTAGQIYIQNPATALAVDLLSPAPGEAILDVCAAPGGKTLQLAEAVGPAGQVVSIDLAGPRLNRLRENLKCHGFSHVTAVAANAQSDLAIPLEAAGAPRDFDAVLADVPCSNTGVLRHRADAKWRLRPRDLEALLPVQQRILTAAAARVRAGGRLIYSTCSIEPEENDGVVAAFLERHGSAFRLEQSKTSFPPNSHFDGTGAFLLRRQ